MDESGQAGWSSGPEVDDSGNPTEASPAGPDDAFAGDSDTSIGTEPSGSSSEDFGGARVSEAARSGEEAWTPDASDQPTGGRGTGGREMLVQLQQMIDTVATQAAPVMRDVAVKAAELAAIAGEKAGPVAYRAAGMAQNVGERVAARSKEYADQLRRPQDPGAASVQPTSGTSPDAEPANTDTGRTDDPMSSDWRAS
jgi:hypothetical protein